MFRPSAVRQTWIPIVGPRAASSAAASQWCRIVSVVPPLVVVAAIVVLSRAAFDEAAPYLVGLTLTVEGAGFVWGIRSLFHFRHEARARWRVTSEERRDFVCRTPEVLAGWLETHRPDSADARRAIDAIRGAARD